MSPPVRIGFSSGVMPAKRKLALHQRPEVQAALALTIANPMQTVLVKLRPRPRPRSRAITPPIKV